MKNIRPRRSGAAWLELLLVLAIVALLFQLFPNVPRRLADAFNFRYWSRSTWFVANLGVLLLLLFVRFGPEFIAPWRYRLKRQNSAATAASPAVRIQPQEDVRKLMRRDEQLRAKLRRRLSFYCLLVPCIVIAVASAIAILKTRMAEVTRAASTLLHSNPGANFSSSQNGIVGIKFSVLSGRDLRVTHLGVYDEEGDGLQLDHRVGIFRKKIDGAQGASLVAEARVPYGRHAPLEGNFRWVALETPVNLSAGTTYVLAAESFGGIDHEGPAIIVGDGWPESFDEEALRRDGFAQAWNPKIIGSNDAEPTTILRTDKAWPACPVREDPVSNGAVHGPANLIIAEGE